MNGLNKVTSLYSEGGFGFCCLLTGSQRRPIRGPCTHSNHKKEELPFPGWILPFCELVGWKGGWKLFVCPLVFTIVGSQNYLVPVEQCGAQENSLEGEILEYSEPVAMYVESLQTGYLYLFGYHMPYLAGKQHYERYSYSDHIGETGYQQNCLAKRGQNFKGSILPPQCLQVTQLGRILTCGLRVITPPVALNEGRH